jgi:nitronate monooxygenase
MAASEPSPAFDRKEAASMAEPRLATPICARLGCDVPILLAGMGGVARSELVAAVARAGGYGILGMVRESPALIGQEIDAVRQRTARPFAVNLIPAATDPSLLDAELQVCLDRRVPAMCFFWDVVPSAVTRAKAAGCLVLHQVGSLAAAKAAEAAGADVLIVQGVEAGGHVHGTAAALVLVDQVVRATALPVIASGGFATGASLVAALALGAQGIHCGTAFLATRESFAHDDHKARVVAAMAEDTVYTDAFALNWPPRSPVRVIRNSVTEALGDSLMGHHPDRLPRGVIAWEDGRPLLKFSTDSPLRTTTGDLEAMAAYAGQGAALVTDVPTAAARIEAILDDADMALARLQRLIAP